MSSADYRRLAQQFCDVVGERQYLSPAKFIEMMGLDIASFAREAHAHRSTVIHAPGTQSIQAHIRTSLQVLAAVAAPSGGSLQDTIFRYRNEPLAPFNCKTAEALVAEGRAADVLDLLESIQARVRWMTSPHTTHTGDSSDLLFLDVDGVLHPVETDYSFSSKFFSHLPLLEELLREFPSVDVVISSDWRLAESVEQLQRYFSEDIRHRIIGATPQINPDTVVQHRRQQEIQAWLEGNGRGDAEWVALDDWPGSFEVGFARLVLTDSRRAFDQDSFQELHSHFLRFAAAGRCSPLDR